MSGIFNTVGHETEQISRDASGQLMEALSTLFAMLREVERGDLSLAEGIRNDVLRLLDESADALTNVAYAAGGYPLRYPSEDTQHGAELEDLYGRLEPFGYRMPLRNNDLPAIGAAETRNLRAQVQVAAFQITDVDWFPIRNITESVERLLTLGRIAARLSVLHRQH